MKVSPHFAFFILLALPLGLIASGPELLAITFKQGQPLASEHLATSVEDEIWLRRAVDGNSRQMRRVSQISYRIVGRADPNECAGSPCADLALRRAQLFQEALERAGVRTSKFCSPAALGAPWPADYQPKPDELVFARQAIVELLFDGCAPKNSFKPNPRRGSA